MRDEPLAKGAAGRERQPREGRSRRFWVAVFACYLVVIFTIASYPTESRPYWDFSWYPFGTTPKAADLKPSSVSGLVR